MAEKTLYISDLDGTLLNPEQKLTAYTVKTITHLVNQGMFFSYATARSLVTAGPVTRDLPGNLPVIVYNGSFIMEQGSGRILASSAFSAEEHTYIRDLVCSHQISPIVYSYLNGKECFSYLPGTLTSGMEEFVSARLKDPRRRAVQDENSLFDGNVFYYTLISSREALLPLYLQVKDDPRFQVLFQQDLYSPHYWCEIMPAAATKANAALKLKELLECDRLVAFGDQMNDATLFSVADACYAVANAHPDLKTLATGVIGANTEDGVAHWLKEHAVL